MPVDKFGSLLPHACALAHFWASCLFVILSIAFVLLVPCVFTFFFSFFMLLIHVFWHVSVLDKNAHHPAARGIHITPLAAPAAPPSELTGHHQQPYCVCCLTSTGLAVCDHVLQAQSSGGAGPKKRLEDAVGWFKGLGAAASNIVGGSRAVDAAEEPEYIKASCCRP
jgi:hypothetical protein